MEDNPAGHETECRDLLASNAKRIAKANREKKGCVHLMGFVKATYTDDGDLGLVRRDCRDILSGGSKDLGFIVDESPSISPAGKRRLVGAELDGGAIVAIDDGRDVSWGVDWARRRQAIDSCGRSWVVLVDEQGQPRPAQRRCGDRLCPCCVQIRIGRLAHRLVPVLAAAVAGGAAAYLITLTQRVIEAEGALVLPSERHKYRGEAPVGEPLRAVGGESLASSYARWRASFESVREDRATRHRWRECLGGYIYGVEWTLRRKGARGAVMPRWHCHGHILAISERPWHRERDTWRQLRSDWLAVSEHSRADAQDCRRIEAREGQTIADALFEVVKYPIKTADLTAAAMVEVFASLRGTRPHHMGGALHSASKLSQKDPWKTWLGAAQPVPSWPRLQFRLTRDSAWEEYSGQIWEGDAWWSAGARSWRAGAYPYWRALSEARASADACDQALSEP